MQEKFFLAIVITIALSCLQNWSTPTANGLKSWSQTEVQHIASIWSETLP